MNKSILFIAVLTFLTFAGGAQSASPSVNGPTQDYFRISEDIKVYPNPATDYIQISNVNSVKKIVVINILGKEMKTFIHYNNAQHDISELKSGMYIVKLLDEKNKVVRTLKFNKSFDGA
ncbi:MAG: T9SS type A sorting domain-containing protein [Saprospiraceae bacterium]|jgi:hypothetical protein|nr:T9SS type A sorting domain-containing protein [Saprospiraceae bacterium]MBL0026658.1 T9SS type A sorting domain-containing protein [Saprospiraceae bacterium]